MVEVEIVVDGKEKELLMKRLKTIFKIALGLGLIIYLIFSGSLNLKMMSTAIMCNPWWFLLANLLMSIVIILTSFRWQILLLAQDTKISLKKTVSLNFIGLFFNLCLPGGTGGDLIKCYYLASIYPDKKTATITTVLIDRFLGLGGLVLIGGLSVLYSQRINLGNNQVIKALSSSILLASLAIIVGLVIFLNFPFSYFDKYPTRLASLPGGKILLNFYQAVRVYRNKQSRLYLSLFLSMMVHTLIIIITIIFGKILASSLNWHFYGVLTPLGLLANGLPIAPSGLGVGEAAFEYLYAQVGSSLGGELIALFHLISIFWGLVGLPFYLFFKRDSFNKLDAQSYDQGITSAELERVL